jgi:hypothetical protein
VTRLFMRIPFVGLHARPTGWASREWSRRDSAAGRRSVPATGHERVTYRVRGFPEARAA